MWKCTSAWLEDEQKRNSISLQEFKADFLKWTELPADFNSICGDGYDEMLFTPETFLGQEQLERRTVWQTVQKA